MSQSRWYQWWGVVWKESLPAEGLEVLYNFGVSGYISPLHNDKDDEGGHPHYHWIMCFPTSKTYDQVMTMLKDEGLKAKDDGDISCINTVKYIKDLNWAKRYLCHLDQLKKNRYSPEDVICLGGTEYEDCLNAAPDKQNDDLTVIGIIKKYNMVSYAQLVEYCLYCQREYYRSVVGRCGFWSAYLRSRSIDPRVREIDYLINETRGKKE